MPKLKRAQLRMALLMALTAAAAVLIAIGAFRWTEAAGYVTSGVLLGVWAVLFLLDAPEDKGGGEQ